LLKAALLDLAGSRYEAALPGLTGLAKTEMDKRLEDLRWKALDARAGGAGNQSKRIITLGVGVKMEFVPVPPGEFMMGADNGKKDEKPVHRVRILRPFLIGKYLVTVAQFRAFVTATNYKTERERGGAMLSTKGSGWEQRVINWRTPGFKQDDNHPVCVINWYDAQEFCKWAS